MIEFVWSVDVAMAYLAFGFAPLDGGPIAVETLETSTDDRDGARLGLIDRKTRIYADAAQRRFPPSCVWVEQPSGRFPKPQLYYCAGVVQAALYETLAVPVWTVSSATWKQRTVGKGNASKAQVAAWVLARGADVNSQDEADAHAIAAAGRAMVLTRSWDATTADTEVKA